MEIAYEDHVRSELAVFLKTKRRRVSPATYGFAPSSKRRTPGLRREEVAELAGVGPTWYTWLEQGRDIRPSARVLQNVAAVLQLSTAETHHLFNLAGHERERNRAPHDAEASPSLQDAVDHFGCPAFIHNTRYDALVWNAAFEAVFGLDKHASPLERNFLWRLFRNDWPAIRLLDREALARHCIAQFRLTYAHQGMSPAFASLVADLHSASALFAAWWAEYPVEGSADLSLLLVHERVGELRLRLTSFEVSHRRGMQLVLAAPESGSETATKIAALVGMSSFGSQTEVRAAS